LNGFNGSPYNWNDIHLEKQTLRWVGRSDGRCYIAIEQGTARSTQSSQEKVVTGPLIPMRPRLLFTPKSENVWECLLT